MPKELLKKVSLAQNLQITDKFLNWLNTRRVPFDVRITCSKHSFVIVIRDINLNK